MSDPLTTYCPSCRAHPGFPHLQDCPLLYPDRREGERREAVEHPNHYGGADNPHEAIKCIHAHKLTFDLGNAVKYIFRAGKKNPDKHIEDLRKAIQYIQFEIGELEKDGSGT